MNYLLQNSIYLYKGKLFSFEIHDSSLDEEIKSEIQVSSRTILIFLLGIFIIVLKFQLIKKAILAINRVKTKYFLALWRWEFN